MHDHHSNIGPSIRPSSSQSVPLQNKLQGLGFEDNGEHAGTGRRRFCQTSGCKPRRRRGAAGECAARRRARPRPASPPWAAATAGRRPRRARTEASPPRYVCTPRRASTPLSHLAEMSLQQLQTLRGMVRGLLAHGPLQEVMCTVYKSSSATKSWGLAGQVGCLVHNMASDPFAL